MVVCLKDCKLNLLMCRYEMMCVLVDVARSPLCSKYLTSLLAVCLFYVLLCLDWISATVRRWQHKFKNSQS